MWLSIAIVLCLIFLYWYTYPSFGRLLYKLDQKAGFSKAKLKQGAVASHGLAYAANLHQSPGSQRPLLLFIHGFGGDKSVWFPLATYMTQRYRVVIPDLIGHGDSPTGSEEDYAVAMQAKRVVALIHSIGETQVHLAGNSMGAHIAAYISIHYSELIASLVVICPAGLKTPVPSMLDQKLSAGNNPFLIDERREFYPFYEMTMARPPYTPKPVKDALAQDFMTNKHHLARVFDQYQQSLLLDLQQLKALHCPVCILWGARDDMVDVSGAAVWQQATGGELIIFDDLGHMPMMEAPKRTFSALEKFYKDIR